MKKGKRKEKVEEKITGENYEVEEAEESMQ